MNSNSTLTVSFLNQNWKAKVNHLQPEANPQTINLEHCLPDRKNGRHNVQDHCRTPQGVNIWTMQELLKIPNVLLDLFSKIRTKEPIVVLCPGTTFVGEDGQQAIFFLQYTPGSNTVHFGYIGKKRNCSIKNVYRMIQAA